MNSGLGGRAYASEALNLVTAIAHSAREAGQYCRASCGIALNIDL